MPDDLLSLAERAEVRRSWREMLPIHPACVDYRDLPPDELRSLGDDIKQHGLRLPIVLLQGADGSLQLLDGKNRLDALEAVGESVITNDGRLSVSQETIEANSRFDADAYVDSINDKRRHDTPAQKRKVIERRLRRHPERSDRAIAKDVGVSHPTVAKVRAEAEQSGDVEKLSTRTDTAGRQQPARKPRAAKAPPEAAQPAPVVIEASAEPAAGSGSSAADAPVTEPRQAFNITFESRAAEFRRLMLLGMRDLPFADWQAFVARLIDEAEDVARNFDRLRAEMQDAGKCE